jgi:hypothetical protein
MRFALTLAGAFALATLAVAAPGSAATRTAGGGMLCLNTTEAGDAMGSASVRAPHGPHHGSGTTCAYEGSPAKDAAPTVTLLTWSPIPGSCRRSRS